MTIPAPPASLGRCAICRHYLAVETQEFVMAPSGPIPLKAVPQSERLTPDFARMKKQIAAPCTFLPNWALQPPDGWCWQYKSVADRVP